jgi:exodeoxyribonuclease VII large subunit
VTASLSALSPLDVLTRGYSVTLDQQGQAITSTEEVQLGDRIVTRLKGGHIESIVDQIADGEKL